MCSDRRTGGVCCAPTDHDRGGSMIWKHDGLLKELRESGRTAPAEILGMRTEGSYNEMGAAWADDSDLTKGGSLCRLELRVMPPDEPPFEKTIRTRVNTFKYTGDTIEVLYDPNDHDKVAFDYQADAQQAMERARPHHDHDANVGEAPLDPELQQLMDQEEAERTGTATTTTAPAPTAPPPTAQQSGDDYRIARLQKLADLHERGALTDAEFADEKARILREP
jgi:hypothetical protein